MIILVHKIRWEPINIVHTDLESTCRRPCHDCERRVLNKATKSESNSGKAPGVQSPHSAVPRQFSPSLKLAGSGFEGRHAVSA